MTELNFNSQSPKSNQTPRLNHSKSISKLLSGLHPIHEPKDISTKQQTKGQSSQIKIQQQNDKRNNKISQFMDAQELKNMEVESKLGCRLRIVYYQDQWVVTQGWKKNHRSIGLREKIPTSELIFCFVQISATEQKQQDQYCKSQIIIQISKQLPMKTIEQTFQKKTPLEHVLLRPDTYVGSIQMQKSHKWVLPKDATQFQYREVTYVPALYKMFDEVLVNAADNYQRDRKMNLLKVEINQEDGFISVLNNGKGIPVEMHKQYNIYVPELIFGHLLTGSNYDDDEKKVVGGRNGYGAKLANIFSRKFIVQCGDSNTGRKFKMVWTNNMTQHSQAQITKHTGKDFTSVTFYPDFPRFKMQRFDDDIYMVLTKRAYDMAGIMPNLKVIINGKDISANSFTKYVDMYLGEDSSLPKIRDKEVDTDRWQVIVSISDGQFKQVSFVNSICTSRGGSHVDYITNQIVEQIQEKIKKKDKDLAVKPFQIKAHLWIFLNCLIENPTFDSQTKETLKLKASQFGSECKLSDKMIKEILKSGVVDQIFNEAKAKQLSKLAKLAGGGKKQRVQGIPKLQDANEAGGKNSQKCTLILTQGDSAKSLAMAGLQVIGRDFYGVFPLKGKLLNVREASNKTLMKNQQIQNLIKILGFQISKEYSQTKSLRYGSIMIMSDQDTDGSHIKGLIINFIHFFWPSLFKINGFLKQFITPILKVTKNKESTSFYTLKDFRDWANNVEDIKKWKIKYYKGLGTSTDKQAKQYFQDLRKHKIEFQYVDDEDDKAIQLIFSKKKVQKRKQWLGNYNPEASMDYDQPRIRYREFVDRQFIHFSNFDNIRSIASMIDGFKPGQRKIIFSCFKRNLKDEIKVAQLGGYVAEHSAYHHGQMSLTQTIVGMAQNFVGSNNINLLMPNGQFGSRNEGGKDHASARYIFTCLNKVTRYIYPEPDDHVLTYIEDDGQLVEPQYYVPILPMGLVNGCEGIGTGWSTNVPNFNPRQIVSLIYKKLQDNEAFPEIQPWFKGFIGEIVPKDEGRKNGYEVRGIVQIDAEQCIIHIKQLPIGRWIKDQKQFIEKLMESDERIVGLREYHTRLQVHFEVEVKPEMIQNHPDDVEYYAKLFKVIGSISMNNMVGFNARRTLNRYEKVSEVLQEFYAIRLKYYEKRKQYLLSRLKRELQLLTMKQRFILEVVQQKIVIRNVKKVKLCETLNTRGYTKFSDFTQIKSSKKHGNKKAKQDGAPQGDNDNEQQNAQQTDSKDLKVEYNYLLNMPLWNLTYQKVEQIKKQKKQKQDEYQALKKTAEAQLWKTDLDAFMKVLDQVEKQQLQEIQNAAGKVKHNGKQKKARKKVQRAKKEKKGGPINWDTESQKSVEKQKNKKAKEKQSNEKTSSKNKKQNKKQSKKKKGGKAQKDKSDKNDSNTEPEDLLSRIKKKHSQKTSNSSDVQPVLLTKSKKNLKTLSNIHDDQESDYEIVSAFKKSKKKKTNIDSDDEDYSGSEEGSNYSN